MDPKPLDPDRIPDDASAGRFLAYVGEDVARSLMLRLTLFVAAICVLAGAASGAGTVLRTAAVVAGLGGGFVVLVVALMGVRRSRQWPVIVVVLVACGALVGAAIGQDGP